MEVVDRRDDGDAESDRLDTSAETLAVRETVMVAKLVNVAVRMRRAVAERFSDAVCDVDRDWLSCLVSVVVTVVVAEYEALVERDCASVPECEADVLRLWNVRETLRVRVSDWAPETECDQETVVLLVLVCSIVSVPESSEEGVCDAEVESERVHEYARDREPVRVMDSERVTVVVGE